MFFKKKPDFLQIVYSLAEDGTAELYNLLIDNNFNIKNDYGFSLTSFLYHLFYIRLILLSKYSEQYISDVLYKCLDNKISQVSTDITIKNNFIDAANDTFRDLDLFWYKLSTTEDSWVLMDIGRYFIACLNKCKVSEVHDVKLSMYITTYFTEFSIKCKTFFDGDEIK